MGSGGSCWCCHKFLQPVTMENYMAILVCDECLAKMQKDLEEAEKIRQEEIKRQEKNQQILHGIRRNRYLRSSNFKSGLSKYGNKKRGY